MLTILAETEIALIEVTGTNQQWTFEIRGDTRSDISDLHQRCRELDIPVHLTELHALTPVETETEAALTDTQQEALILAYERGYFESPREVTLEELGAELGISQQAVGPSSSSTSSSLPIDIASFPSHPAMLRFKFVFVALTGTLIRAVFGIAETRITTYPEL